MQERRPSRGIDVSLATSSPTMRAAPWGALAVSLVAHLTVMGVGSVVVFSPEASHSDSSQIVATVIDPVIADPEPTLLQVGEWEPAVGQNSGGGGHSNPAAFAMADGPVEPTLSGVGSGREAAKADSADQAGNDERQDLVHL